MHLLFCHRQSRPSNSSLDIILSLLRSGKSENINNFNFMSSQEESTLNECVSVVTPDTKQGRAIPCVKESISVAFWGAACVDRVQQS